ncbi:nectin-3 [Paramisgurnus dabryanus]|uniref:nectin-3 n=1 Tax=Paramisgurnus dabryanus TaxID=90735 RepID=UPI0031F36A2B
MLSLMVIFILLKGVCLSDIVTKGDTNVVFGKDASLSCALSNPSGVKQVTWQRVHGEERAETLATFSEVYKKRVEDPYVGKVFFTMASFNSTSIVIKNVTFEVEACYICSFQAYPVGAKWETLCLTVKGISEITASIKPASSSDSDVSVTCSATGKPTPILQWKSTEKHLNLNLSESNTSIQINSDGSNTTTSELKITLSQFHGKYVECVAESGKTQKSFQISLPRKDDKGNVTLRNYTITISLLIIMGIVIIFLYIRFRDEGVKHSTCIA